ncbi:Putative DD37D maT transposase, partial [Caligus rogercresseyi]
TTKKFNPQNDRILFRNASKIQENTRNVYRMQKPASVMAWGAVISNGKKPSLLRIPDDVKINKIEYLDVLQTKVFPWIQEKFGGVPIYFQQDGAPTHIAKI